jgi:hypothetical protein
LLLATGTFLIVAAAAIMPALVTVSDEDLVRDTGAKWRQKYQPSSGQREWRIKVVTYG